MNVKPKKLIVEISLMALTVVAAMTLGTHVPGWYEKWKGNNRNGEFSQHVAGRPAPLTLYGTKTCPACIKARAYLRDAGVSFNDRVLEDSESAKQDFQKLGISSVPVLLSDDTLIIGFNKEQYSSLAGIASNATQNRSLKP